LLKIAAEAAPTEEKAAPTKEEEKILEMGV